MMHTEERNSTSIRNALLTTVLVSFAAASPAAAASRSPCC